MKERMSTAWCYWNQQHSDLPASPYGDRMILQHEHSLYETADMPQVANQQRHTFPTQPARYLGAYIFPGVDPNWPSQKLQSIFRELRQCAKP